MYSSPRASADGGTLLVAVESPASDLWMYDIRSGSLSQRTYDAGATSPVWTPDGQSLIFTATVNRNAAAYADVLTQLYQVAAVGGEPRRISNGKDNYANPYFRPDGKVLYHAGIWF